MTDNIDYKNIGNRKFIIELRYDYKVLFLDKRGQIVEAIRSLNVFSKFHWNIGQGDVIIKDDIDDKEVKNSFRISINQINFISYQIDSVESYYNKFEKIYNKIREILGDLEIFRIGCRIIGSYYTKSGDFNTIIKNMKDCFPKNFLLEKYPSKDMNFSLVYENGMYNIGPLSDTDIFYARDFDIKTCKKHIGIAIDTDNYIQKNGNNINDKSLIKDVYTLSLSVEKDLYSNLKDF